MSATLEHLRECFAEWLQIHDFDYDYNFYTPAQWRQVVDQVMAALEVTVDGSTASAVGPSGIPGRTRLVRVGGRWLFATYPPSIES